MAKHALKAVPQKHKLRGRYFVYKAALLCLVVDWITGEERVLLTHNGSFIVSVDGTAVMLTDRRNMAPPVLRRLNV